MAIDTTSTTLVGALHSFNAKSRDALSRALIKLKNILTNQLLIAPDKIDIYIQNNYQEEE